MSDDSFDLDTFLEHEKDDYEYREFSYDDTIRQNHVPRWSCPCCQGEGTLRLKDNNLSHIETNESKRMERDENFEADWLRFVSSIYLECSYCKDVISVTGRGTIATFEEYPEYDEDEEKKALILKSDGCQWSELAIRPLYFYPTIHLFKIPNNVPEKIKEKIIESFSLAWSDCSAAGNKIRVAIEYFIDEVDGSLDEESSLGNQINELEKKEDYKLIAKRLKAIKWIGNQGSHSNKKALETWDVGFAYTVLSMLLDEKYLNVDKFVKVVNEKKGTFL